MIQIIHIHQTVMLVILFCLLNLNNSLFALENATCEQLENKFEQAQCVCAKTLSQAQQAGDNVLAVRTMLNFIQSALKSSRQDWPAGCPTLEQCPELQTIAQYLAEALPAINQIESAPQKMKGLLRLGRLSRLTYQQFHFANKAELQQRAYHVLNQASNLADKHHDIHSKSQALGYLGQLYKDSKRYQEALALTHQAIFLAQQPSQNSDGLELLYYWQWQAAAIHQAQGNQLAALPLYRGAINNLWAIRYQLSKIYRVFHSSFREEVGPLFLDFIELLLEHANFPLSEKQKNCQPTQCRGEPTCSPGNNQPYPCLKEAQQVLEKLKTAELFDYFQNECVLAQTELTAIQLDEQTAIVYPIIFADKLEILIHKQAGKIVRRTVTDINRNTLKKDVDQFIDEIIKGKNDDEQLFLPYAKKLYNWLIIPIKEELEGINNLVIVPDGSLRRLPIAALHDGTNYLIKQYAVTVVPGLTLIASDTQASQRQMLLAGLETKKWVNVQERKFEPLEIKTEINQIENNTQNIYAKHIQLLNQRFTSESLKNTMENLAYSAIHIASHAIFELMSKKVSF